MSLKFNYYYGKEAEQFSFFRIPKLLFTNENFSTLSSDAKILYGILLDRMSLSMKNNWIDEENKVYIIFTIEEIAEILHCGMQKATKTLKELDTEKGIGLVEKKRLGLGKPNVLYVKNFAVSSSDEESTTKKDDFIGEKEIIHQELCKSQLQNDENHHSRNVNFTNQEWWKSSCNKTNINKTEYSDTDFNHTSPISPSKTNGIKEGFQHQKQNPEVEEDIETLKQNIEYFSLIQEKPEEKEMIDLMINLMTEVIQHRADRKINQSLIPFEKLKEQLLILQKEHIEYVLLILSENKNKISNLRVYLLSLLYNAPVNILGMKVHQKPAAVDYSKDKEIWQAFFDTT